MATIGIETDRPAPTARKLHQARMALELAQETKAKRGEAKRALRAMTTQEAAEAFCRMLDAPPSWARTWRFQWAVQAIPKWGPAKTERLLAYAGLEPRQAICEATAEQRQLLKKALRSIVYDRYDRPIGIGKAAVR